jgi:hypothetical protein
MPEYKFIEMTQSERGPMGIAPGAQAHKVTKNMTSGGCSAQRTLTATADDCALYHINGPGEVVIAIIDARLEEAEMFRLGKFTPAPMPAGAGAGAAGIANVSAARPSDVTDTFTLRMTAVQLDDSPTTTAIIYRGSNLTESLLHNGTSEPTDEDEDEEKPRTNCCCSCC